MHRVFIPPEAVRGGTITITDAKTLHHLRHVLRLGAADRLECFDGRGHSYVGSIVRGDRRQLTVSVDQRTEEPTPRLSITLAQALIRPERFEWLLEKATELGVVRVIPMMTDRTTARVVGDRGRARQARWQRIIASAASQCGRAKLPLLEAPQPFQRLVERFSGRPALLPTLTAEGESLAEGFRELREAAEAIVLIGPEGDFSPAEVALATRHGARPVGLGRHTLRSETAAIAILAVLQHAAGAM